MSTQLHLNLSTKGKIGKRFKRICCGVKWQQVRNLRSRNKPPSSLSKLSFCLNPRHQCLHCGCGELFKCKLPISFQERLCKLAFKNSCCLKLDTKIQELGKIYLSTSANCSHSSVINALLGKSPLSQEPFDKTATYNEASNEMYQENKLDFYV